MSAFRFICNRSVMFDIVYLTPYMDKRWSHSNLWYSQFLLQFILEEVLSWLYHVRSPFDDKRITVSKAWRKAGAISCCSMPTGCISIWCICSTLGTLIRLVKFHTDDGSVLPHKYVKIHTNVSAAKAISKSELELLPRFISVSSLICRFPCWSTTKLSGVIGW